MQRPFRRHISGWWGLLGALSAWPTVSGCPGSLSPQLLAEQTGAGGTGGTGGTGGATATGGAGGSSSCTGDNDGASLVATTCATQFCHDRLTQTAGLDLTVDANVGARLVGVYSAGINDSVCANWPKPYLVPDVTNPVQGLLIDKFTTTSSAELCPPDGTFMPYGSTRLLPAAQQACIEQWAAGLVMAAAQ